jgi:NAD(P)-dependent dehydrogenase (short-subunit alcohol dehydrogenase family)
MKDIKELFDITGKVVAITGAGGVLCGCIAKGLAAAGAKTAILDLNEEAAGTVADEIVKAGGQAVAVKCNVLERESVEGAYKEVVAKFGAVDVLINGAGGNNKNATTSDTLSFFDLPADATRFVFDLNFIGTLLPSQIFGKAMAECGEGQIMNISSMNAFRPLTKIPAYSAAKAAVSNFTQWLSVHMCQNYSKNIRVNAIAPGFFITHQNRFLVWDDEKDNWTPRGQSIVDHTPMGRFGEAEELIGPVVWLLSDAAKFVTGTIIPIDGGFDAFSGV